MNSRRTIYFSLLLVALMAACFFTVRSDALVAYFVKNDAPVDAVAEAAAPPAAVAGENYLVLYTQEDDAEDTARTYWNLCQVLGYIKKPYETVNPRLQAPRYGGHSAVIVVLHDLTLIGNLDELCRYVEQGGKVYFTSFLDGNDGFLRIYRKLGINEAGNYAVKDGIELKDNALIGAAGLTLKGGEVIQNYGLNVTISDGCTLHATAANQQPLLWETGYGRGKFVVFNGTCLSYKFTRGLLLAGISYLSDPFVYPVLNMKMMFIDDFPAPFPAGETPMISAEYNCDIKTFFRNNWWQDMTRLEQRYGFKYTCVAIETYSNNVHGPFVDTNRDMTNNLRLFGYEVVSSGGELGIHGYNHQSLAPAGYIQQDLGYTPWDSVDDMAASLTAVRQFMSSVFQSYQFQVYVPPSNILSDAGREAIKRALPDVSVISSLYNDSPTGDELVQEFSVAPDGIVEVPRVTSGYEDTDINLWSAYSALSSLGVFSHFVHPDDILDPERSHGRTWAELYKSTDRFIGTVLQNYRWLTPYTASQAANHVKEYLATAVSLEQDGETVRGRLTGGESMSFLIRSSRRPEAVEHCTVQPVDEGAWLLECDGAAFSFRMTGGQK